MEKPVRFSKDTIKNSDVSSSSMSGAPKKVPSTARIEYNISALNKFVEDRGIEILWEKSFLCPCRNPMTKAPLATCHICRGRGIAYLPAEKEKVAVQSQQKGVFSNDMGLFDSGTAIGTTRLESKITFRDRITIPDVLIYQSFIFNLTQDRIDNGMYLVYDVNSLELVTSLEGELVENIDYKFDKKENRIFVDSKYLGKNISINMDTVLRYIVIDLLKESRYQYTEMNNKVPVFENLPRKLLLKREDAFIDSEPFYIDVSMDEEEKEGKLIDPKREMLGNGGFFGGAMNG